MISLLAADTRFFLQSSGALSALFINNKLPLLAWCITSSNRCLLSRLSLTSAERCEWKIQLALIRSLETDYLFNRQIWAKQYIYIAPACFVHQNTSKIPIPLDSIDPRNSQLTPAMWLAGFLLNKVIFVMGKAQWHCCLYAVISDLDP